MYLPDQHDEDVLIQKFIAKAQDEDRVPDPEDFIDPKDKLHMGI